MKSLFIVVLAFALLGFAAVAATAQTLATRAIIGATGALTLGTTAGTGTGLFYAGEYFVGTTAGCDGTPGTATKGIVTACTGPEMSPEALYTRILSLESQLAALQAAQRQ